ncbi:MAG: carbamoyltransferase C-terminal domain-containing protein [bacterium]
MYILGLNYFPSHDTAACLLKDGQLLSFVEEERLNRLKHTRELPFKSIDYTLANGGIAIKDIDYVAIGMDYTFKHFINRLAYAWHFNLLNLPLIMASFLRNYIQFKKRIKIFRQKYGYDGKIVLVNHHTAHLASAFFVSPYKEAAAISIDGSGTAYSGKTALGKDNRLIETGNIKLPHSIGLLYLKVTNFLGWPSYGSEGTVMGLAPYGSPDEYYERFKDIIKFKPDGQYRYNMKYFKYDRQDSFMGGKFELSNYFYEIFGPARQPKEPLTQRHKNIAAALQKLTEEVIFHQLNDLYEKTKQENLCLAGGVIMNSVANGKIRKRTPFKNIYISPLAFDAGNALGAAFYVWHQLLSRPRSYQLTSAYLGPEYSNEEIKQKLEALKASYEVLDNPAQKAAQLIAEGKVIGWFQGKIEVGARALGNRSILADPRRAEMKDIVNNSVKFREPFRPFAPSILLEKAGEYFEDDYPVPFMEKVYDIKPEKRQYIPAVTHVDGTGRLQTVSQADNPKYWQLIKEFEKITGIPIVFNTSFNIKGEPIVCSPKDALNCFYGTGMDYLIIGNFLVKK